MNLLERTISSIQSPDIEAMNMAQKHLDKLLKPKGSLGKLEDIAKRMSGITGQTKNRLDRKTILVMTSDNGVAAESVSAFPDALSVLVVECMLKGLSGVSVLGRNAGAELKVVDLGLAKPIDHRDIIQRRIRAGTSNIAQGPAMTRDEAILAMETGIEIANMAIDEGAKLLGTGEVGIGNTTTSSAVLYALTGRSLDEIVGRGTGVDDEGYERKKGVIARAVELNKPDPREPLDVLVKVGGFDIGGMTGCFLAAAARRVPIVIDGFISGVAALLAARMKASSRDFMFPSHASTEAGLAVVMELLNLEPIMRMNMRLGEGTGCALAFHIMDAAMAMMNEMGTFADIGM